jgi:hypothetical protein
MEEADKVGWIEFLNEQKNIIYNCINDLKCLIQHSNNKPEIKEMLNFVINSIVTIYDHMRTLVEIDFGFPNGNLMKNMVQDTLKCLTIKKKDEEDSFFSFLNWLKDMIEKLTNVLLKNRVLKKEMSLLQVELADLKLRLKFCVIKKEEETEFDEEEIPTEMYEFEKLDSKINEIFSEFGERRWILVVGNQDKDEKIQRILKSLKWNQIENIYFSPNPVEFGDESLNVKDLLEKLNKEDLLEPCVLIILHFWEN